MARDEDFLTWEDIVREVCYAHEPQYPPTIYVNEDGTREANFHKLTFVSTGEGSYKTSNYKFDPKIFWKIEMLVNLYNDNPKLKILYGND